MRSPPGRTLTFTQTLTEFVLGASLPTRMDEDSITEWLYCGHPVTCGMQRSTGRCPTCQLQWNGTRDQACTHGHQNRCHAGCGGLCMHGHWHDGRECPLCQLQLRNQGGQHGARSETRAAQADRRAPEGETTTGEARSDPRAAGSGARPRHGRPQEAKRGETSTRP